MLIAKIQNSKSENCMANITLRRGGIWSLTEPPQKTFSNTTTKENSRSHNPCHHLLAWLRPRRRSLLARQQQQQQPVEDQRLHRVQCTLHILPWFWCLDVQVLYIRKHYLVVQRQYKSRTWSPRRGARAFHHLLPQIHSIEYCLFNCVQHHLCHSMTH